MRDTGEESKRSERREEEKSHGEGKEGWRWRIKYKLACWTEPEIE
jgi:hypothetical protein